MQIAIAHLETILENSYIKYVCPSEETLEIFGQTNPNLEQRTQYFEKCWEEWADNEIAVGKDFILEPYTVRRNLGGYNCIIHGRTLRFRNKEYLVRFLFDVNS